MPETPKVFISYSHDSPAHKQWVAELATRLRHAGIDAVLDQWDLGLGDDVTRFMEQGVGTADRVLVVCTDEYVRKADAGKGGVGYERLIVTAELVQNLGTNKFIPVIRHAGGEQKTPKFLGTRLHIDFSNDEEFEDRLDDLLRELHRAPTLDKPPLGKNPYAVSRSGEEVSTQAEGHLVNIPKTLLDPIETYRTAVELARSNDLLGWRQLVKKVRAPVSTFLIEWRRQYEHAKHQSDGSFDDAVDEAVRGIAPLLVIALAGVESGRPELNDQRSLLDDIYEVDGWALSGLTVVVDLPGALCYVYQALHGAVCLLTGQLELALELVDMQVRDKSSSKFETLFNLSEIISHPASLMGHSDHAWKFLTTGFERWPWLAEIFGTERDYRSSLAAYYMALNIYEFTADIAGGGAKDYAEASPSSIWLMVPPLFFLEDHGIQRRAYSLLIRNKKEVAALWERKGLKREEVKAVWPHWLRIMKGQRGRGLGSVHRLLPYEGLLD